MSNHTNGRQSNEPPPRPVTISTEQLADLMERAADGDLLRRGERAWQIVTGENLRVELAMLAETYEAMRSAMASRPQKPAAGAPA